LKINDFAWSDPEKKLGPTRKGKKRIRGFRIAGLMKESSTAFPYLTECFSQLKKEGSRIVGGLGVRIITKPF